MSTNGGKRHRTTLVKNKREILEGRHIIDLTDERLAHRRREDYQATLGQMSSIHRPESLAQPSGVSGLWRRLTHRSRH